MQAVDLNSLLEGAADSGDSEALRQLLNFSPSQSTILNIVRRKKDYTLLKTFASLINFKELTEELFAICIDSIADGTFTELESNLPTFGDPFGVCSVNVSVACSRAGIDYEKIPDRFKWLSSYLSVVIEADNLDLFLKYESQITDVVHYFTDYGKKCAKKLMTHYGFSPVNLNLYLCGAFFMQNKETLSFLRSYPEVLESFFLHFVRNGVDDHEWIFVVECIRERLVVLSDDGWQTLKTTYSKLYDELQNDV